MNGDLKAEFAGRQCWTGNVENGEKSKKVIVGGGDGLCTGSHRMLRK